jgi:DNA-binding LytR/AlgR family response regulator
MRVLIADDEPLALERLAFAFRDIDDVEVVGEARNGIEAADKISALAPDVVILDIQMPGRTGMAVAAALPAERRPEVIFVTAYEHFAADAFDVEAVDYLIKPVRLERLRQALERARRRRIERAAVASIGSREADAGSSSANSDSDIVIPDPRGDRRVPIATIDWIEAAKDYVLLHTQVRSHMVRMTMSELERRLDPAMMLRVHRSAFVRRAAIREVRRPGRGAINLVLEGEVLIAVGPSYLRTVDQALG